MTSDACALLGLVVVVVLGVATPEVASVSASDHAADASWRPRAPGEVRCFCNLPSCVTSGYMCKSLRGGCFSDLYDLQDVNMARHGCLELLDSDQQGRCQNEPGSASVAGGVGVGVVGVQRSLLLCCRSDMCNHVDGREIRSRVEETSQARLHNASGVPTAPHFASAAAAAEVWFKAATIAVPICGALILFALIALAVRILRGGDGDDEVRKAVDSTASHHDVAAKKRPLLAKCGCKRTREDLERGLATERYDLRTAGFCEKGRPVDV